jgi:hypothetical protein
MNMIACPACHFYIGTLFAQTAAKIGAVFFVAMSP